MQRNNYAYSNATFSDFPDSLSEMKIQNQTGSVVVKPQQQQQLQQQQHEDKNETSPTFVSKAGSFFLPRFFVEVLVVAALSALAYYLRFNDDLIFGPYLYPIPCQKNTGPSENLVAPYSVSRDVFLYVLFAAPIGVFLIGESIRWALGVIATKTVMVGKLRIGQSFRRIVRIIGCFYTGIVLTSIITDMLQLFISRPTPNFISACLGDSACPASYITIKNCTGDVQQAYKELRAFPSYRATLSAYAATYAGWYLHFLFEARGSFVLRPFLATGCVALAMMPSLTDWAELRVNWEDVAVGLALGVLTGIYMVANVNFFVEAHDSDIMKLATLQTVIKNQAEAAAILPAKGNYTREPPIRRLLPRIQAINTAVVQQPTTPTTPAPPYYQNGLQRSNTMPVNRNLPANGYNRLNGVPTQNQQPPIYAYGTSTF